jgi:cytochrome b561
MLLKNTPAQYGAVTKALHWAIALLIVFMLCLGLYMGEVHDLAEKLKLFNLHKSVGACVLVLAACRVLWHLYSRPADFVATLKWWEKAAARVVHMALYFMMFAMPLSGWAMSAAAGRSVRVFGLFTLPDIVGKDEAAAGLFRALHDTFAWTLMGIIALHVAGALKHHLIDHDITLKRMLPFTGACLALLLAVSPALAEMKWVFLPRASAMGCDSGEGRKTVSNFTADVSFDPRDLANSRVSFRALLLFAFVQQKFIDPDVSRLMNGMSNTGQVPENTTGAAQFTSSAITRTGANEFSMTGTLTLNGKTQQVTAPFTVSITGADMVLKGGFAFDPRNFSGNNLPDAGSTQVTVDFEFHEAPTA